MSHQEYVNERNHPMTAIRVDASTLRVDFPGREAVMAGRSIDSFASAAISRVEVHPDRDFDELRLSDADAPGLSSAITKRVRR
jgi:hypothetical protein